MAAPNIVGVTTITGKTSTTTLSDTSSTVIVSNPASSDKVFNNIVKYGNTTAASLPIALKEAILDDKLKSGDILCLAAFGSGFTWASALIKW